MSIADPGLETEWYDEVPKVELHVHLEGAIPHEALFELIRKYGGDPIADPVGDRFVLAPGRAKDRPGGRV